MSDAPGRPLLWAMLIVIAATILWLLTPERQIPVDPTCARCMGHDSSQEAPDWPPRRRLS